MRLSQTLEEKKIPSRQAVRCALAGHWPGRLLRGELVIDDEFVRDLIGLTGEAIPWAARKAVLERLHHDVVVVPFSGGWGNPQQPDLEESVYLLRQWRDDSDLFAFALIDGPFSRAAQAWGWEKALVQLSRGGSEVEDFLAETVVTLAEQAVGLAGQGAEGIILGDDIAYRQATYIKPAAMRQTYLPYLTILVDAVQAAGLPVVFHSDGNLWAILGDLQAAGINGLQGLEPGAAMGLPAVRERVGPNLCLWGNVDLGWLAQPRPAPVIQQQVRESIQPLNGTPFILGTAGGLVAGLPGANVEALFQVELAD
jgi:uroporphyrinogen-III decarboxylase